MIPRGFMARRFSAVELWGIATVGGGSIRINREQSCGKLLAPIIVIS